MEPTPQTFSGATLHPGFFAASVSCTLLQVRLRRANARTTVRTTRSCPLTTHPAAHRRCKNAGNRPATTAGYHPAAVGRSITGLTDSEASGEVSFPRLPESLRQGRCTEFMRGRNGLFSTAALVYGCFNVLRWGLVELLQPSSLAPAVPPTAVHLAATSLGASLRLTNPIWVVRPDSDSPPGKVQSTPLYRGSLDCFRRVYREEGVSGLLGGNCVVLGRD